MTLEQDGEQTPLLDASKQHEVVYQRFSRPRKRMILSIASLTGLLPRTFMCLSSRPLDLNPGLVLQYL